MAKTPACGEPDCRAHQALALLGTPHVLDLLFTLVQEERRPWRFGALQEHLGIASNILSDRLRRLAEVGLVERKAFQEMPPRVEYAATEDAVEMAPAFQAFARWAARRHRTTLPRHTTGTSA